MPSSRHLAAIMFADIMGFTAMMEDDESRALELRGKLKKKLEEEVAANNGQILDFKGDGALCSFHSTIEGIRAAMAVQLEMQQDPVVPLRIGIHTGDVIFDDNTVYGDGVNIASRMESFAVPGSIFISGKTFDDIKNQKDIQTVSLGKYSLKNVKEPIEIFAISNPGLQVPLKKKLEGKGVKYSKDKSSAGQKYRITRWVLPVLAIGLLGFLFIPGWIKKRTARNKLLPEIEKMATASFLPPTKAFDLAKEAEKYIPNDSSLLKLWPKISNTMSCITEPAGANVYWKDYNDIKGDWKLIGKTPFKNVWVPKGFPRIKIEKDGFKTIYSPAASGFFAKNYSLKLDSVNEYTQTMVKVGGSESAMLIVGLEQYGGQYVDDFLMDKYEVTNREFNQFIDADGYGNKKYWDYPFYSGGKEIKWEQAMELFHDKTARPGPAGWEAGTFPDGKENHPVTGVSWYEAMAYAKFAGKKLPTIFHWSQVANTFSTWEIIPRSNFNGTGTVPVGSLEGISYWGVYDIAGNAREWCFNEMENTEQRFILGGGWNDPTYGFNDGYSQPALDRSLSNGFRCMMELPGDTTLNKLSKPVKLAFRDYNAEKPVDDKTFDIFLRQYSYDHSPLNSEVLPIGDSTLCKVEKITMDAAYNKEKLVAYLFIPKNISPPYQTVLFFPGSNVIYQRKFDYRQQLFFIDFILKSGRAVCFPILKGTFERGGELHTDLQDESVFYKEHVIAWVQDINRCLDYIETRKDFVHDKFGFHGFSWGSAMAPIVCAVEKRFKAVVVHVGGLMMQKTLPEVDPLNFLPHVKIPTLMLNGKNDTFFPLETSQKPMFNLLGTPVNDKKIIIYEGGHLVPRSDLIKESLDWFDKYLGQVK